jgi:hypothetical protein
MQNWALKVSELVRVIQYPFYGCYVSLIWIDSLACIAEVPTSAVLHAEMNDDKTVVVLKIQFIGFCQHAN